MRTKISVVHIILHTHSRTVVDFYWGFSILVGSSVSACSRFLNVSLSSFLRTRSHLSLARAATAEREPSEISKQTDREAQRERGTKLAPNWGKKGIMEDYGPLISTFPPLSTFSRSLWAGKTGKVCTLKFLSRVAQWDHLRVGFNLTWLYLHRWSFSLLSCLNIFLSCESSLTSFIFNWLIIRFLSVWTKHLGFICVWYMLDTGRLEQFHTNMWYLIYCIICWTRPIAVKV